MNWDDLVNPRGKPLPKQVWACDCMGSLEGIFRKVTPNKNGECPICGYYAVQVSEHYYNTRFRLQAVRQKTVLKLKETRGRKLNLEAKQKAVELRESGLGYAEIAKRLNIGIGAAHAYCTRKKGN